MKELNDTAHKLLDYAEAYTQTRGFNAFSYRDLQRDVEVKTSSIHYYFPTKQDLALSMVNRYIERYRSALETESGQQGSGLKRLKWLGAMYVDVLKNGKFCLCGMLASDIHALPEEVNEKLKEFFALTESWISEAITLAQSQGEINKSIDPESSASHFLAMLEGGMLMARTQKTSKSFEKMISEILKQWN